jgi:hypothetical protein
MDTGETTLEFKSSKRGFKHIVPSTVPPRCAEVTSQHLLEFVQDIIDAMITFLDNKDDDDVITDETNSSIF